MARARLVSARGSTRTSPFSTLASTSPCSTSDSAPFGPFTVTVWPSTLAVTPEGMATGFFPTRDMALVSRSAGSRLEHGAENLSAHVVLAGIVIGHHALGRGQDRDAQPVIDAREGFHRGVDPPPRLRHPRNLADHRLAVEIFQLDLELPAAVGMLDRRVAADEPLGFQHVEHAHAQPRRRRRHLRLVAHLRIVNAGNHVAERIDHRATSLPARLDQARDQPPGAEIAQRDARQPELAIVAARPARDLAAIADAGRGRVARQLRELERRREPLLHRLVLVARNRFQAGTPARILLAQLAPPAVLLDRALLRHQCLLAFRVWGASLTAGT